MGIEINQLPNTTTMANEDIIHLQVSNEGNVDKHITKSDMLAEIQAEVNNNAASISNIEGNVSDNSAAISDLNKSIVLTGGGNLVPNRVNELQDGDNYTLPPANSLDANTFIDVELTDTHSAFTPSVLRSGSDTISFSGGTDTDFIFDAGSMSVRFTSNGVSDWRI